MTYGARTIDDMSFAWMSWYYLSDQEYKQELEARNAKTSKSSNLAAENDCRHAFGFSVTHLAGPQGAVTDDRSTQRINPEQRKAS